MRIHFIFPTAKLEWPLIQAFARKLPQATFDCGGASGFSNYRYRIQLLARTPHLVLYALRSCLTRLREGPGPDYICVQTDAELLGCWLAMLWSRRSVPIILVGFIYTPRASKLLTRLRHVMYRLVLSRAAGVVCYSQFESRYYAEHFRLARTRFAAALYGSNFNVPADTTRDASRPGYLLSVGRSGRDYQLLCDAVEGLPHELHIVCDVEASLKGLRCPPNVKILRSCYGKDYVDELLGAELVVVPLKDEKLSSGQMVLLNAMAVGRPTVISKTVTIVEYGEHLQTCHFVEPGSAEALRTAIVELMADPAQRERLGTAGKRQYLERHTVEPAVESIVDAIREIASDTAFAARRATA